MGIFTLLKRYVRAVIKAQLNKRRKRTGSGASGFQDMLESFDHVVVLMLENRSFDNLLGNLYEVGNVPRGQPFEGLSGQKHCNPIPDWAPAPKGVKEICTFRATDYHNPYPDPGEIYPHVNTQLFGTINPDAKDDSNRCKSDKDIVYPYNLPNTEEDKTSKPAPMNGFVKDYISTLCALTEEYKTKHKKEPPADLDDFEYYQRIMECFYPDQLPVMSKLAQEFAVFDHWFCSVPSQTWCNRAFWHAGTSWGHVLNGPSLEWVEDSAGTTLFNLLEDTSCFSGLDWKIYSNNFASFTGLIHLEALLPYHFPLANHFESLEQFIEDAAAGDLPSYSFLEPHFWTPHNDQHPSSYDSKHYGEAAVGSVLLGEVLINKIYNAIRKSNSEQGNNWQNTLLIITHDEHGGCYDHVSPPTGVHPPGGKSRFEQGFDFKRLGVRVPMIMVSAYIEPHTIVNNQYEHASFLRTMCQKWRLPHLTDRDKNARAFTEVFNRKTPRDVSTWPNIPDPLLPPDWWRVDFSDAPLNDLQRSHLEAVAFSRQGKGTGVDVSQIATVGEAIQFLKSVRGLPGLYEPDIAFIV